MTSVAFRIRSSRRVADTGRAGKYTTFGGNGKHPAARGRRVKPGRGEGRPRPGNGAGALARKERARGRCIPGLRPVIEWGDAACRPVSLWASQGRIETGERERRTDAVGSRACRAFRASESA